MLLGRHRLSKKNMVDIKNGGLLKCTSIASPPQTSSFLVELYISFFVRPLLVVSVW